jgi:formyltetrahydrofolate synthetase
MTYQTKVPFSCTICGHEKTVARKLCRRCYSRLYARKAINAHSVLTEKDVFEQRFDKIKATVQSMFNAINNQKEFEDVLSYMIDEFKYVTDSAKITAIRKVLALKSKPDTEKV